MPTHLFIVMLKQGLQQKLQQGLSPLQIMTNKLLVLPALELEQEIRKNLEENIVLEENTESEEEGKETTNVSLSDYAADDSTPSYKLYVNNQGKDLKPQYNTFSVKESFHQSLERQLGYRKLKGDDYAIAKYIIGSLDDDGYLRRDLASLSDEMAFREGLDASEEELERILKIIQEFEPLGIGARDLQECLLIQLNAKEDSRYKTLAIEILTNYFSEFTKKHYQKIITKLDISEEELKSTIEEIVKLNPKPGGQVDDSYVEQAQQIVPDFILEEEEGILTVTMPKFNIPDLRINKRYAEMLIQSANSTTRGGKEAIAFVKQKVNSAKWFVEAVKQRYNTLQNTMEAIVDFQKPFFLSGDEMLLKPMVLKDIAAVTNLDISTISRVVSSKYIQTQYGIYSLKYFFSEGLINSKGEEVSTKGIKKVLQETLDNEDKKSPLTDEELVKVLTEKGYIVARRTVAKYREQLGIPIARLRKSL